MSKKHDKDEYREDIDRDKDEMTIDVDAHDDSDIRYFERKHKRQSNVIAAVIIIFISLCMLGVIAFLIFGNKGQDSIIKNGDKNVIYLDPDDTTEPLTEEAQPTVRVNPDPDDSFFYQETTGKDKNKNNKTTAKKSSKSTTKKTKQTTTKKSSKTTTKKTATKTTTKATAKKTTTKPTVKKTTTTTKSNPTSSSYYIKDGTVYKKSGGKDTSMGKADTANILTVGNTSYYYSEKDSAVYKLTSSGNSQSGAKVIGGEGDFTYFLCSSGIIRIKSNGNNAKLVKGGSVDKAVMTGKFITYTSGGATYCMKPDGSGNKKLSSGELKYLSTMGSAIYGLENGTVCKITLSDSGEFKQSNLKIEAKELAANDGYIYYVDEDRKLYRAEADGSEKELLTDEIEVHSISISGEHINFKNADGDKYQIRTDGSDLKKIDD